MDNITLGERIKMLRKDRGTKSKDLAVELGVTPGMLSKWEGDVLKPNIYNVCKLAKALNTTTDYLLGLVDEPNNCADSDNSNSENLKLEELCAENKDLKIRLEETKKENEKLRDVVIKYVIETL